MHILQVWLPAKRSCYQNFASTLFKYDLQCGAPIVGLMTFSQMAAKKHSRKKDKRVYSQLTEEVEVGGSRTEGVFSTKNC
jgi:hypothetical protein